MRIEQISPDVTLDLDCIEALMKEDTAKPGSGEVIHAIVIQLTTHHVRIALKSEESRDESYERLLNVWRWRKSEEDQPRIAIQ